MNDQETVTKAKEVAQSLKVFAHVHIRISVQQPEKHTLHTSKKSAMMASTSSPKEMAHLLARLAESGRPGHSNDTSQKP